jgi:hypothetical protein
MFRRPDAISSFYSYEDCSRTTLQLESGLFECQEYAQFSVDVPPLTPPFSYNYDCSSVILTAYIPVYIYMYALLALMPLGVLLFGFCFKYYWFPGWLQARFPGILWPFHWSMGEGRERSMSDSPGGGALRVRTSSDMSTESDLESDPGLLLQRAEPKLMINVIPIVTNLMHNLYILSTFGLCSPYLAMMVAICASSHIVMWKVMLGRFVTCRVVKVAEIERNRNNSKQRERTISHVEFLDSNIHKLMEENTSTRDEALIAVSEQLNDAKGIFAICIWPILLSSSFFFIFVSLDIAGDRVSWTGGLWIPAVFCVIPLLLVWTGMKVVMHKRSRATSGPSGGSANGIEHNEVELNTVENVLHTP